jgi:hypothetical protein
MAAVPLPAIDPLPLEAPEAPEPPDPPDVPPLIEAPVEVPDDVPEVGTPEAPAPLVAPEETAPLVLPADEPLVEPEGLTLPEPTPVPDPLDVPVPEVLLPEVCTGVELVGEPQAPSPMARRAPYPNQRIFAGPFA